MVSGYSAMTGQSLYYMGTGHLKHKILAIAEEEGVAQASYALKLLQSDGKLTIAAAGKNSGSGRQSTETYTVQGPVMMFLTTTSENPDAELQNRCLTLRVNESSDQTAEIHNRQRASYMQSNARPARYRVRQSGDGRAPERLSPLVVPLPQSPQRPSAQIRHPGALPDPRSLLVRLAVGKYLDPGRRDRQVGTSQRGTASSNGGTLGRPGRVAVEPAVNVHQGKGKKDRVVPIGQRANQEERLRRSRGQHSSFGFQLFRDKIAKLGDVDGFDQMNIEAGL